MRISRHSKSATETPVSTLCLIFKSRVNYALFKGEIWTRGPKSGDSNVVFENRNSKIPGNDSSSDRGTFPIENQRFNMF